MDFIDLRPSHNLIKKDIINKIKKSLIIKNLF